MDHPSAGEQRGADPGGGRPAPAGDLGTLYDLALTRLALLARRLQALGRIGHTGHKSTEGWQDCPLEPCASTSHALRYAGLLGTELAAADQQLACPACGHCFLPSPDTRADRVPARR